MMNGTIVSPANQDGIVPESQEFDGKSGQLLFSSMNKYESIRTGVNDTLLALVQTARDVFRVSGACICLKAKDKVIVQQKCGLNIAEIPKEISAIAMDKSFTMVKRGNSSLSREFNEEFFTPFFKFFSSVPLIISGERLGYMCIFDTGRRRYFDEDQQALLQKLGDAATEVLSLRWTKSIFQHQRNEQTAIGQILKASSRSTMSNFLRDICLITISTLHFDSGVVVRLHQNRKIFVIASSAGIDPNALSDQYSMSPNALCGYAYATRSSIVICDLENETRFQRCEALVEQGFKTTAAIAIPASKQGIFGYLVLSCRDKTAFVEKIINSSVETITKLIGYILEQRQLQKKAVALIRHSAMIEAQKNVFAELSENILCTIASMKEASNQLHDAPLADEQRQLVESMQLSSDFLLSQMNTLLRTDKFEQVYGDDNFDLKTVVENIFSFPEISRYFASCDVSVFIDPDTWTQLYGNAAKYCRILTDLLLLVLSHSPSGHVVLSIESTSIDCILKGLHYTENITSTITSDTMEWALEATQQNSLPYPLNNNVRMALEAIQCRLNANGSELQCTQQSIGGQLSFMSTFKVITGSLPNLSIYNDIGHCATSLNRMTIGSYCLNHLLVDPTFKDVSSSVFILSQSDELAAKFRSNYFEKRQLWHITSHDQEMITILISKRLDIPFILFHDVRTCASQQDLDWVTLLIAMNHPLLRIILIMPCHETLLSTWRENPRIYRVIEKPVLPNAWDHVIRELVSSFADVP